MKLRLYSFLAVGLAMLLACDVRLPDAVDTGLSLGNPAQIRLAADTGLVMLDKGSYQLCYEHARNQALLAAWHLQADDLGAADRSVGFTPEPDLPAGWYRVVPSDYTGCGYDRGHLCPSADRTASPVSNRATFILSNVIPQAKGLNRHVWERLEAFTREQIQAGCEAYVYAGGIGEQARIGQCRNVPVPAYCWKVILLMPAGERDADRPAEQYRLVAVLMPNIDKVSEHEWTDYQVSLEQIEAFTGLHFFGALPPLVRARLL